ncbi:MAG: glucose-6-phosphate dehydrogenase [Candidatus Promineifilaceae bacterium]|nr:glucose-6-phosphate dehydrogenase [Candidatus Promineifilaceae bacterium]
MAESTSIIIFGASGDLAWRKLVPALYNLCRKERLHDDFQVVGFARSDYDDASFRERMRDGVERFAELDDEIWERFASRLSYVQGSYDEVDALERLKEHLAELEPERAGRLYYLSVPPKLYAPIIHSLGEADMVEEAGDGWRRVVIEKPFGHNLPSARQLNRATHAVLDEEQIYRIDHYLGKETVQNILVFRFANAIFEPVWNRNYISDVQITAAESVDVGRRGGYYDQAGVMRDMFQNHLMQLLTLVAMEPPASFEARALRNEKVKVLASLRPHSPEQWARQSARGQYAGYPDTEGVAADSQTATFAALTLYVDNWRWQGVPFYLRSGKALARKTTEIVVRFKRPPHLMFNIPSEKEMASNYIALCIQPDEGIHLRFEAKVPDSIARMQSVDMEFHYDESFAEQAIPEAYERLLLDAVNGDAALFTRADEIELAWKLIDTVLEGWQTAAAPPLLTYERGSWGPEAAAELLAAHNGGWIVGCLHEDEGEHD